MACSLAKDSLLNKAELVHPDPHMVRFTGQVSLSKHGESIPALFPPATMEAIFKKTAFDVYSGCVSGTFNMEELELCVPNVPMKMVLETKNGGLYAHPVLASMDALDEKMPGGDRVAGKEEKAGSGAVSTPVAGNAGTDILQRPASALARDPCTENIRSIQRGGLHYTFVDQSSGPACGSPGKRLSRSQSTMGLKRSKKAVGSLQSVSARCEGVSLPQTPASLEVGTRRYPLEVGKLSRGRG